MFRFLIVLSFLISGHLYAQNLFLEECFVGGVTVAGRTGGFSFTNGHTIIKWDDSHELKAVYALTYRYNRPQPKSFFVNGSEFLWDYSSQIGEEQKEMEEGENIDFFAVHGMDITENVIIDNDSIHIYMDGRDYVNGHPNQGWWSIDFVVLYTSPLITDTTCIRIYTASQPQIKPQNYEFKRPKYKPNTDVAFSIYSDRIGGDKNDESLIGINNTLLGMIWGTDAINFLASGGVRGHFYYENHKLFGLDDDTANTRVFMSDGIAIINEYLNNEPLQKIGFTKIKPNINIADNPHIAFFIAYTPTCTISSSNMNRRYEYCFQQSPTGDILNPISLQAIPGYDHYAWTPAKGLSDSTIANPICTADSSRWYRVSMWNDNGDVCDQTIPVFVTVHPVPRPAAVKVKPSICPSYTGQIDLKQPAGKGPFEYFLNGEEQPNGMFDKLPPGSYEVSIQSTAGCAWDSTIVIPLEPVQKTAFTANPDSGYTPLRVVFLNKSEFADGYTWLINNEPFTTSNNNLVHTFDEPGTYEVALVAYRQEESCTDTAFVTINVYQGLSLIIPNIITPNNDGRNDALVAQTAGVEYMRWEVFNRWGNSLHSGEANHPPTALTLWRPEPNTHSAGTYTVVITARGESGEVRQIVEQLLVQSTE